MPNHWFRFKQFSINQDRCAMKVSTDACIQGAWAARQLFQNKALHVLDIGTGTGLLSLMLAQALPTARFDAIEINEEAYLQARSNFENAPWKNALRVFHTSLADFIQDGKNGLYQFIICNPPFFQDHLESQTKARNDARHSQSLGKAELAPAIAQLLAPSGKACILFPVSEWELWLQQAATCGLHMEQALWVKPKPDLPANRVIGLFTKEAFLQPSSSELVIYREEKQYTAAMESLLKDYYLRL